MKKFLDFFSSESLTRYYTTLEKPENMKKFKIFLWSCIALFMVLGFVIPAPHEYAIEGLEKIPIFYSFFGFIACIGIVAVSKTIGHFFLEREENYYDE